MYSLAEKTSDAKATGRPTSDTSRKVGLRSSIPGVIIQPSDSLESLLIFESDSGNVDPTNKFIARADGSHNQAKIFYN